jgi:hypothetical protein
LRLRVFAVKDVSSLFATASMSKTACDIKDYKPPKDATYICKKCGLKADKEKQLCKPKKR